MHEFWTNPTVIMTYTRSQNYTNMVVGEHGMQTFEVVVVMLLFFIVFLMFSPHKCTSLLIFGQVVCPNILKCQFVQY